MLCISGTISQDCVASSASTSLLITHPVSGIMFHVSLPNPIILSKSSDFSAIRRAMSSPLQTSVPSALSTAGAALSHIANDVFSSENQLCFTGLTKCGSTYPHAIPESPPLVLCYPRIPSAGSVLSQNALCWPLHHPRMPSADLCINPECPSLALCCPHRLYAVSEHSLPT